MFFSQYQLPSLSRMLTGCPTCTRLGEERAIGARGGIAVAARVDVARTVAVIAAGSAVGFLTGLFGVGGGFVIVPALTLLLQMNMPTAIGTSLLVISVNSAVALAARIDVEHRGGASPCRSRRPPSPACWPAVALPVGSIRSAPCAPSPRCWWRSPFTRAATPSSADRGQEHHGCRMRCTSRPQLTGVLQ